MLVTAALGQQQPENPRLDVNGDGVVDGKDLALVAEHLGEGDAPAASYLARSVGNRSSLLPVRELPLGFTLDTVEHALNILRATDDGTLTFKRGIDNLERLLAIFVPEKHSTAPQLPEPVQPRDMDTLSVGKTCRRDVAYLFCDWCLGADTGVGASTRRGVSHPEPCGILGMGEIHSVRLLRVASTSIRYPQAISRQRGRC